MAVLVYAVERPELQPLRMPDRFRMDVAYFHTPAGSPGVPPLEEGEFYIDPQQARQWLDDGTMEVISPLDSAHKTEIELSDEQEHLLQWLVQHGVSRIRLA